MSVSPLTTVGQQQQEAAESPEALMISALLETGHFRPEAHRVGPEMLSCWQQLWAFCVEYQAVEGHAPPLGLVEKKWPSYEHVSGVGVDWAAGKLREAAYYRSTRRTLAGVHNALREEDQDALASHLAQLRVPPAFMPATGTRTSDAALIRESAGKVGWTFPWSSLQAATDGLGRGELVYWAARFGQGKSQVLTWLAPYWAEQGVRVRIVSLEMPKRAVARRVNRNLARHDRDLRRALSHPDANVREAAVEQLYAGVPGWVEVIDPTDMSITTRTISAAAQGCDVLMVDHAGLLKDEKGTRAVDDWRIMQKISNTLKETALAEDIGLLAAAQINRDGETRGTRPPDPSKLSQSDGLGQDGDQIVTQKLLGRRSMALMAGKVREGLPLIWYSTYEPDDGSFAEISKDEALARMAQDEADRGDE